jgi:hypothetical protein
VSTLGSLPVIAAVTVIIKVRQRRRPHSAPA